MFERRIKAVRIHPEVMLALFQDWKKARFLTVFNVVGVPEGCQVVAVYAEQQPCSIMLHVYHPTFPEVPMGEFPPMLFERDRLSRCEVVRLIHAGEEDGISCFKVPAR